MESDAKKTEFKNLRLTIYKFIIFLLIALYFCQKYYVYWCATLETILGITAGLVLIAEGIKIFESGKESKIALKQNDNENPADWIHEKDVLGNDKPKG